MVDNNMIELMFNQLCNSVQHSVYSRHSSLTC